MLEGAFLDEGICNKKGTEVEPHLCQPLFVAMVLRGLVQKNEPTAPAKVSGGSNKLRN